MRAGGSQGHGKERGEGDDRNEGVKTSSHKDCMARVAFKDHSVIPLSRILGKREENQFSTLLGNKYIEI